MATSHNQRHHLAYIDRRRAYFKRKWKDKTWRHRRAVAQQKKWREDFKRQVEAKRKNLWYESGMAMAGEEDIRNNVTVGCSKCGKTDHKRSSSKKCPFNKKYGTASGTVAGSSVEDVVDEMGDEDDEDHDEGMYERTVCQSHRRNGGILAKL